MTNIPIDIEHGHTLINIHIFSLFTVCECACTIVEANEGSESLELELTLVLSCLKWVLGTKLGYSGGVQLSQP